MLHSTNAITQLKRKEATSVGNILRLMPTFRSLADGCTSPPEASATMQNESKSEFSRLTVGLAIREVRGMEGGDSDYYDACRRIAVSRIFKKLFYIMYRYAARWRVSDVGYGNISLLMTKRGVVACRNSSTNRF